MNAKNCPLFLVIIIALMLSFPLSATADPAIGDACTTDGQFMRTGGTESSGAGSFMVCESSTWKPILGFNGTGQVTTIGNQTCTTGQVLAFDGTTWNCADGASGDGGAGGSTMIDGWPDAITCTFTSPSWGKAILSAHFMPYSSGGDYFYRLTDSSGTSLDVRFNASGTQVGSKYYNGSSWADATTSDCGAKSISTLYTDGQAFNFVGGGLGSNTPLQTLTNNTIYQNTSGAKLLVVAFGNAVGASVNLEGFIGSTSTPTDLVSSDSGGARKSISFVVPNGWYYQVKLGGGVLTSQAWELSGSGSADNLGNHTTTENIKLGANYLSGDGGDEGIYVNSDGEVGIGTNDPQHGLDVNGAINTRIGHMVTTSSNGAMVLNSGPDSDEEAGFWFRANSTLGDILTSTELVRIKADGHVGIGTTDPKAGLDILSDAITEHMGGGLRFKQTAGDYVGLMLDADTAGATKSLYMHYGDHIQNGERENQLRFGRYADDFGAWEANPYIFDMDAPDNSIYTNNAGNVGIGTADPSVKLDLGQTATNWIRATGMYIEDHDGGFGKIARIYNHNETFGVSREAANIGGYEESLFSVDLNTGNAVFGGNIKTTGVVKIGTQTACASEDEGGIRYVGGAVPYEYCDGGGTWLPFKQPACGDDDTAGCYIDTTRSNSDPELIAANIVSGVNILGVTGTAACGGGGGATDLIGATHDSDDCVALGGTAFESPEGWICQLSASSCPGGWSQHNSWSATANRTCTGVNNDGCWQATSCGTSSHAWSNNGSLETCSYNNSSAVGEAGCSPNGATCTTYRTQIGCI